MTIVTDDIDTDLSARSFWAKSFEERERTFAWLRANQPVSYHRPYESTLLPPDDDTPGFWAVVRYDDIRDVSRDAERFSSAQGIVMEDFPEVIQVATTSFLSMDAPEHTRMRGIVSRAFTPGRVRKMNDLIQNVAKDLVDDMIDLGQGDFCELFAAEMPGRIFAHFFGIDPKGDEAHTLMDAAANMLAWDDPAAAAGRDALTTYAEEAERIQDIALRYADDRREQPGDDMISWVVNSEADGEVLEDWEVASFFSLLGSAANDTTRHTIAHGIRLFAEFPDQRDLLLEDLEGRVDNAVEEVLRHATPVQHFRRTATRDTEIAGTAIKAGDKVVMWYCSGDRDESVFPDSARFDIVRSNAKAHQAFGAGGAHFCIGASLGRSMVRAAFVEIFSRMPDIRPVGEVEIQINNFMHGIHHLPVRWSSP
jgi:cytochrome P450